MIASDKAALDALDKKIAANKISASQARAEMAKVDDNSYNFV